MPEEKILRVEMSKTMDFTLTEEQAKQAENDLWGLAGDLAESPDEDLTIVFVEIQED